MWAVTWLGIERIGPHIVPTWRGWGERIGVEPRRSEDLGTWLWASAGEQGGQTGEKGKGTRAEG